MASAHAARSSAEQVCVRETMRNAVLTSCRHSTERSVLLTIMADRDAMLRLSLWLASAVQVRLPRLRVVVSCFCFALAVVLLLLLVLCLVLLFFVSC